MFKKVLAVMTVAAIAAAVGLLGLLPALAQQGGPSATRSFDRATVEPGGEVVVTIAAADYGTLGAVTETLPAGFSYVSSSLTDEGEVTEIDDQTVRFTLQGADKTFTYTVTASSTADSYDFSGKLRDSDRNDYDVIGPSRVTVEATAPQVTPPAPPMQPVGTAPSATRSFDRATVAPGGEVVVTIAAADYGTLGAVTETLPAGFSYVSSSLTDEGEVTEIDDQTVRFTLQGADKTFTYTVTASSTADSYDFSGKLRDSDRNDYDVIGPSRVTVEAVVQDGTPSAVRSFDPAEVAPGGEVVVTIAAANYGQLGAVTETLPAGFSYVSSSLIGEGEVTEINDGTVRFTLQGADKTFTYTVTASSTAGPHTFSGQLRDEDRDDHTVGDAFTVTVEGPKATRSFAPARIAPGGRVVVTITAANYGRLGAVTETLPAGFSYVSSSLTDAGEVTEIDDQTVRFTLQGADKTFTYTVTASSTADSYTFSGTLRDSDRIDRSVSGVSTVKVAILAPPPTKKPTPTTRPSTGGGGGGGGAPVSTPPPTQTPTATPVPTIVPTTPPATLVPTAVPDTPMPTAPVAIPVGPPGEEGEQGEPGTIGDPGLKGKPGTIGDPGPKGETGSAGSKGTTGDAGPKGATGSAGETGARGDAGPIGEAGATGKGGSSGILGIVALILGIVAIVGVGGAFLLRRN